MNQIESYRDLEVWQKAMDLVVESYRLSGLLPRDEDFVLKIQIRRAAVSVPSNIAEGHGRTGSAEYLHHLSIAHGSLMELETQLLMAVRLGFLSREQLEKTFFATTEVSRMLKALIRSLRASLRKPNFD